MEEKYELRLENFSGPLEKLLELIEEKQMEITRVSLAAVTEDFLKYMAGLKKVEFPLLADFISVASRLVLLKSKSLLPGLELSAEDEEGIKDLENRLKLYNELKPAIKILAKLWREKNWELARSYFLEGTLGKASTANYFSAYDFFYPGENLSLEALLKAMGRVAESFEGVKVETETIKERVVSLEDKIKEVVAWIQEKVSDSFRSLSDAKTKSETIVIFLAILHLAREQLVHLEQETYFSDIMITKK